MALSTIPHYIHDICKYYYVRFEDFTVVTMKIISIKVPSGATIYYLKNLHMFWLLLAMNE
jgi:hypothetical protein